MTLLPRSMQKDASAWTHVVQALTQKADVCKRMR
jgi:hypothetical protein